MDTQEKFEMILSNLANTFLTNALETPQRILPVAEKIAKEAQEIVLNDVDSEAITFMAKKLLQMMDRSLFLVDTFAKGVAKNDYSALREENLIAQLDQVVGQSENEDRLVDLLTESISSNHAKGISLEKIYYENYLVEYVTSLMEISAIQQLTEKKDLLTELKPVIENPENEFPYDVFHHITGNFKKDFASKYYPYETVVQIMETE